MPCYLVNGVIQEEGVNMHNIAEHFSISIAPVRSWGRFLVIHISSVFNTNSIIIIS
jgi:hypothetical protein